MAASLAGCDQLAGQIDLPPPLRLEERLALDGAMPRSVQVAQLADQAGFKAIVPYARGRAGLDGLLLTSDDQATN